LGIAIKEENPRLLKVTSHIEVAEPEPDYKQETTAEYPELVAKIKHIVLESQMEARAHEVRLYGPGNNGAQGGGGPVDAVIHLDFPPTINMGDVHRRTELVERMLSTQLPKLGYVVIHAEPREEA
jgi:divalent metal cation (Fe/Co/Zn/Cd) transporter